MNKLKTWIFVAMALIISAAGIGFSDIGDIASWPVFTSSSNGVRVLSNGSLRAYPTGTDSSSYLEVVGGNLIVNDDTTPSPTQTLNGADGYVKGFFEVDGIIFADGGMTIGGAVTLSAILNTDSLIRSITAPLNYIDLYDSSADIVMATSAGNDVKINLGAATDYVYINTGNLDVDNAIIGHASITATTNVGGATLSSSGLATLNSASVTTTLGVTGISTLGVVNASGASQFSNSLTITGNIIGGGDFTLTDDIFADEGTFTNDVNCVNVVASGNLGGATASTSGLATLNSLSVTTTSLFSGAMTINGIPTLANNTSFLIGAGGAGFEYNSGDSVVMAAGRWVATGLWVFDDGLHAAGTLGFGADASSPDASIVWDSTGNALDVTAANVDITGNINAAGGYKCPFFFEYANVAASWTSSVAYVAGGTTTLNQEHVVPYAGYALAMAVAGNAALTTGSITFEVCKNGAGTGLTVVLTDASAYGSSTQAVGLDAFAAGDRLTVELTSDALVAPNTNDYSINVIITQ